MEEMPTAATAITTSTGNTSSSLLGKLRPRSQTATVCVPATAAAGGGGGGAAGAADTIVTLGATTDQTAVHLNKFQAAATLTGSADNLKHTAAITHFQKAQLERQQTGLESNTRKQGSGAAAEAVVAAHAAALQHMLAVPSTQPLTVQLLCEVHAILCKGNPAAKPGKLRKIKVKAGPQTFCSPAEVEQRLGECLATANMLLLASQSSSIGNQTSSTSHASSCEVGGAARAASGNVGTAMDADIINAANGAGNGAGGGKRARKCKKAAPVTSLPAAVDPAGDTIKTTLAPTTSAATFSYVYTWPPELLCSVIVLGTSLEEQVPTRACVRG